MKNKLSVCIRLILALLALALVCASAAMAETEGDFTYEYLPGGLGVRITAYTGSQTAVSVPDELGGNPVVAIGHASHIENAPVFPDTVTEVVLPENLTEIGADAFAGLSGLTQLTIPASVDHIGAYAFEGAGLHAVELPEALTEVSDHTFMNCADLAEVSLPEGLVVISASAFENTALTGIALPEGLRQMDARCFAGTLLTDVTLPASMDTSGGALFNGCPDLRSITVLHNSMAAYDSPLTNNADTVYYVDPDSATAVNLANVGGIFNFTDRQDHRWRYRVYSQAVSVERGYGSGSTLALSGYDGADVAELTLPEGAVMLDAGAFSGHGELTTVNLAASMTFVAGGAFSDMPGLTNQVIPATVTRLGAFPFANDPALETITLSGENTLADGGLTDSASATVYAIPLSATTRRLGDNLGHFDFVDLGDTLWTYRALSAGESDALGLGSVQSLAAIAYRGADAAQLTVLDGVNLLGAELFMNHVELTQVDLPTSLIVIDDRAFSQVESLERIVVPEGVTRIGERAFDGCRKASSVSLPSTLKRLDDYTFNGCLQVRGIELPDNMDYVGNNVLGESDVAGARTFSVNIASHTASLLGNYSFFYDKQNPDYRYRWVNGLFLNHYLGSEAEITVNSLVVGIDDYAFCVQTGTSDYQGNSTLRKITFPASVKTIGGYILRNYDGTSRLEEVVFEGAVNGIGYSAFQGNHLLERVSFGGAVNDIGYSAFSGCSKLDNLVIPEGSQTIQAYAFNGCSALTSLSIPESVYYIGDYAFYNAGLPEITLKDSDLRFGNQPFSWPTKVYCALEGDTAHRLSDANTIFMPNQLDADHQSLRDTAVRYIRNPNDGTETLRFYYYTGSEPFITLYDKIESLARISEYGYGDYYPQNFAYSHTNGARILADPSGDAAQMISDCGYGFAPDRESDFDYSLQSGKLYIFNSYLPEKLADGSYTGETRELDGATYPVLTQLPAGVDGIVGGAFGTAGYTEYEYQIPSGQLLVCLPGSDLALAAGAAKYVFLAPSDLHLRMFSSADGTACTMLRYSADTEEITVPEGVTHMEERCFYREGYTDESGVWHEGGNNTLKRLYLPSTLVSRDYSDYGNSPVYGCGALEEIHVPEGVTALGAYQLALNSPDNTRTTIAYYYLPDSLTAMADTAITRSYYITYDEYGMETYTQGTVIHAVRDSYAARWASEHIGNFIAIPDDGWIYKWQDDKLYVVGYSGSEKVLTALPEGVDSALAGDYNGTIFVTDDVTGDFAKKVPDFYTDANRTMRLAWQGEALTLLAYNDADAEEVTVPEGVTHIADRCFYRDSYTDESGVWHEGGNNTLKRLYFPSTLVSRDYSYYYSNSPVYGCGALEEIHVPEGVTALGAYQLALNSPDNTRTTIAHYYLPDSLTAMADTAITRSYYITYDEYGMGTYTQGTVIHSSIDSYAAKWASEKLGSFIAIPDDGWTYKWQDDKLFIAGYRGEGAVITELPENVEGVLPDADLGSLRFVAEDVDSDFAHRVSAFYTSADSDFRLGWEENDLTLLKYEGSAASPVISDPVTVIGAQAFRDNNTLRTITLPTGVRTIRQYAFYNCSSLSEVSFPESLETIEQYAFYECYKMLNEPVVLPEGLKEMGAYAFNSGRLYLPDNMTRLEDQGGSIYVNIGSATSLIASEDQVLWNCQDQNRYLRRGEHFYLASYNSSNGSLSVNPAASGLILSDRIGMGVIQYTSLTSITLPDNCVEWLCETSNTDGAFIRSNYSLTTLTIPEGTVSLPAYTARDNPNLTYLVLPRSLESIDPNAFDDSLTTVYGYGGTYAETWATEKGLAFIDLDDEDSRAENTILKGELSRMDVGDTLSLRDAVRVTPDIGDPLPLSAESLNPEILAVDGETLTALKPGSTTLYVWVDGHELTEIALSITVYNAIEDFTVPERVFVQVGSGVELSVENVVPAQTDNRFTWDMGKYGTQQDTSSVWMSPDSIGATNVTVTASSGVSKTIRVVAYQTLGNIALSANNPTMTVGDLGDVTVSLRVDTSTYTNPEGLYTLTSTNPRVVTVWNNRLIAVGEGTANISARTITGTEARRPVTVTVLDSGKTLKLPANTYSVEAEAFAGTAAVKVYIPFSADVYDEWGSWIGGGMNIGKRAFADSALKVVEFEGYSSMCSIAQDAFEGCGQLVFITHSDEWDLWEYANNHGFIYIYVP